MSDQKTNLQKKIATLESVSDNRSEQCCPSDEHSPSEPSHLEIAKNGMNDCTHTYKFTLSFLTLCNYIHKVFGKLHSLCVAYCSASDKSVALPEPFWTPRKDLFPIASASHAVLLHYAAEQAKVRLLNAPSKQLQREFKLWWLWLV